jgi:stage III sporulation protein AB
MKLLGAVLIILASTWAGVEWSRTVSERSRQLRQLKAALQSLEAEIVYGMTPLSVACSHICRQVGHPISWFFDSFRKKLDAGPGTAYEAWKQLGATIGQHDREHEQKQIKLALIHLEREESEARDNQMKYERMFKSLGVLGGILLVILLI